MVAKIIIFLVLNFAALALGGLYTGPGVESDWYSNLNQAPWTPPGWVFGAAWISIMICFSFYMAYAVKLVKNTRLLLGLFGIQWILNVLWNPVFFYYHAISFALFIIAALTLLIAIIIIRYRKILQTKSLLLLPYLLWLLIATSLNAYILIQN